MSGRASWCKWPNRGHLLQCVDVGTLECNPCLDGLTISVDFGHVSAVVEA